MSQIRIDSSAVTPTVFQLDGGPDGAVDGAAGAVLDLEPGEYGYRISVSMPPAFRFTVTADGRVDYPDELVNLLSGRGTDTLTVLGCAIRIDGRALSTGLTLFALPGATALLERTVVHDLRLLPGANYQLQTTATVVADFGFGVDGTGNIVLDPQYQEFASADGSTLTLSGYPVTVDARALSAGLRPNAWLDNDTVYPQDATVDLVLLPGRGYRFRPAPDVLATVSISVDATGTVRVDPPHTGYCTATGSTLTIAGYQVTVDGRELGVDLQAVGLFGVTGALGHDTTHRLTLLPVAADSPYLLRGADGRDFAFDLTDDGLVGPRDINGPRIFRTELGPPIPDTDAPSEDLWSELDAGVPIALLPVRLESRYGTRTVLGPGGKLVVLPVLRVRIYPDDISVASEARELTPVELVAGQKFWVDHNAVASTEVFARQASWEVLVRTVGVARAGYVADACKPDGGVPQPGAPTAPTARLLPDSWVVVGISQGREVFARHVLRSGPDPQMGWDEAGQSFLAADPLLLDAEDPTRWLTDFDAATRIGMAAVIDLATVEDIAAGVLPAVVQRGLDALYVVGAHGQQDPAETAGQMADLLEMHRCAGQGGFVAQGTATNNLADRASGFTSATDLFAGYGRAVDGRAFAPTDFSAPMLAGGSSDGEMFERALGLVAGSLYEFGGADGREQWLARNMALTLFPVTIGEVINTLTRPTSERFDEDRARAVLDVVIPFARDHVAGFVRGRGPLPVLRIGHQPYGILPVMPWERWQLVAGEPEQLNRLTDILTVLRPCWEQAAGKVPMLTADTANPDALTRILQQGAVPHPDGYQVRGAYGVVRSFVDLIGITPPADEDDDAPPSKLAARVAGQSWLSHDAQVIAYRNLLAYSLGDLLEQAQLQEMRLAREAKPMSVEVAVTRPQRVDWKDPQTYLRRLAEAHPDDPDRPTDLLFVLAEHALARAGELDAQKLLTRINRERFREISLVAPEVAASGLSAGVQVRRTFDTRLADLTTVALPADLGAATINQLVESPTADFRDRIPSFFPVDPDYIAGYTGTRDAVRVLAEAEHFSDAEYTRLTGEALACCSTRLDAWVTSVATQRLATLRDARPTGLNVGAWGVLLDVRPWPAAPIADVAAIPVHWPNVASEAPLPDWAAHLEAMQPEAGAPVNPDRQVGYVHAPSLRQAVTAGVLRAGELAHHDDGSSLASMDLTSIRVRAARDVLRGLSNGQPLGALLGYRLERSLAESQPTTIATLRRAFPQRRSDGDFGTPVSSRRDEVVPADVVDGHEVLRAGAAAVELCAAEARPDVQAALAELQLVCDALADVLVAEGVHGIATGRPQRAGALFKATSEALQPPELTVTDEPRGGVTITNRVIIGIAAEPPHGGGWKTDAPRAILAPQAERWAQSMLGEAADWRITVGEHVIGLDTLGVCALDVIVESRADASGGRPMDRRFGPGLSPDAPGYPELFHFAGAVYDVLAASRPAVPADTANPTLGRDDVHTVAAAGHVPAVAAAPSAADLADVCAAIVAVSGALEAAVAEAIVQLREAQPGDPVGDGLMAPFAALNLPGSLPTGACTATDALTAASAAQTILRDVDELLDRSLATPDLAPADIPSERADKVKMVAGQGISTRDGDLAALVAVARRIGGDAVVPTIAVESALGDERARVAAAPADLDDWLTRMARVRRPLAGYEDLRLFAETLGAAPPPLIAYQLPLPEGPGDLRDWLGGILPADGTDNDLRTARRLDQPYVHIVGVGPAEVFAAAELHGLVVDEVIETVPTDTASTGLALHYDAPNACAPQSILLAVHPSPPGPWHWRMILECAQEALWLARIRGVELDHLAGTAIDEFFPLIYLRDDDDPKTTALDELTKQNYFLMKSAAAYRWLGVKV